MGITGGFGVTMDLERGTSRQWVMGRDGVKRWADNGAPVDLQAALTESNNEVERLRAALLDTARRVEALKRPCGMNPESPQAIRNGEYMSIALNARAALTPNDKLGRKWKAMGTRHVSDR